MPKLAETDGQDLADSIAATIGEKLMGAKFSLHEAPFPSSAKLDVNKAINPDGSLDVDALKAEVTKVRSIQRSLSSDRTNRPSAGSLFPAAKQTPNPTRVRTIRSKLEQFLIPAWSSDTECLDSFFFRAFTESGVSVFQKETIHLTDADTLESIQGALKLFREMLSRRLKAKLTIPLPFSLLQSALLPHIQKTVSSLPQRERLLHLRLEIVQIPESVDAGSLVNIRETFRPFIRDIAFSTTPLNPNSQILALDHIVVGGELDQDSTLDDESLFQSLLHFRHRAGRRTSYLLGLDSRKNINAALRAGFHEVGGHGLGNVQRQLPDHVTHVSREELLSS